MIATKPPETTPTAAACKICGKPLTVHIHVDLPRSDLEKLLPMATCNRCYDQHDRIRRAREKAHQLCGAISQLNLLCMGRLNVARQEKMDLQRSALRERMTKICYSYCCALAEKHGLVWTQPVAEIVDALMDDPQKMEEVFKIANAHVRRLAGGSLL